MVALALGAGVVVLAIIAGVVLATRSNRSEPPSAFFRGDAAHSGVYQDRIPYQPRLLWRFPTTRAIEASPAVAGGRVYVAADDSEHTHRSA